jgi:hypothetical protein
MLNSFSSMCDSIMHRSFTPWLHPDFLFEMSSAGKLQKRCLDILHGTTKRVIESRRKKFLQTAGSQKVTFEDNEDIGKLICWFCLNYIQHVQMLFGMNVMISSWFFTSIHHISCFNPSPLFNSLLSIVFLSLIAVLFSLWMTCQNVTPT